LFFEGAPDLPRRLGRQSQLPSVRPEEEVFSFSLGRKKYA
jgi:hypothetical protein